VQSHLGRKKYDLGRSWLQPKEWLEQLVELSSVPVPANLITSAGTAISALVLMIIAQDMFNRPESAQFETVDSLNSAAQSSHSLSCPSCDQDCSEHQRILAGSMFVGGSCRDLWPRRNAISAKVIPVSRSISSAACGLPRRRDH